MNIIGLVHLFSCLASALFRCLSVLLPPLIVLVLKLSLSAVLSLINGLIFETM